MPQASSHEYDEWWGAQWDDMKTYGPFSRHVRRLIHKITAGVNPASILDVGCGQGSLLLEFSRRFPSVRLHGTDLSPVALQLASKRVPSASFSTLDLTAGHLEGRFDLVLCSEVLEHISEDEAALANLRKMTAGHLIVTTPQGRMRSFEPREVGHVRNYAHGELQAKMRAAGFEIVRVIEWGFPLYSPLYRDYLELTSGRGTTGTFGPGRRALAAIVYWLFMLNSSRRGDELVVLARPAGPDDGTRGE